MAHELPLLVDLAVALLAAFVGGLIARMLKLPAMVGYLVGGVAIGPFTPGYVGNLETVQQLAELGIIFLMFGIGIHFSIRDLWEVRRIAIPGALLQIGILTLIVVLLSPLFGWSLTSSVLMGLALSIASTVVMLRAFMDQGLLNTPQGKIAVGWLVLEDLVTVLILVLLPTLTANQHEPFWQTAGMAVLKASAFAAAMILVGTRVIPWALTRLAFAQSRELFMTGIVLLTVGTALCASAFFGVSLALGAFLAGVVVSESSLSHQVNADTLPFRDLFAVLFFVSVGMLVNPLSLWQQIGATLAVSALIILGKFVVNTLITGLLARSAHTALVLAAGRSQIGEFSFLLGSLGVSLKLLTEAQYSLLLAGAMASILVNPFLARFLPSLEQAIRRVPFLFSLLEGKTRVPSLQTDELHDHVIVVGYGRVGQHIVRVLGHLGCPRLVVELDLHRVEELDQQGVPTLYGDAANSEILSHTHVEQARAVVITVPDETSAAIIVTTIRQRTTTVPIIVRAATQTGLHELFARGASAVTHPELEGGLNVVRQTLLYLGFNLVNIDHYTDAVRHDHYDLSVSTLEESRALDQLRAPPPSTKGR
jgi:CPA2 family monovalent cation:H+ antiporter-2